MIAQLNSLYLRTRIWKIWSRLISYTLFEGRPLTSRGRWINLFVFTLFAIEKKLPCLKRVEKPVFILGTGRSGTTVLGMVLSMHREVGFLNEPKALWHAIHPNEDLIGSYSGGKACYRLGAEKTTPKRIKYAHRLFGAYLTLSFSHRVVDKYPELVFRVPFVKALFPDAKFLFIVRNGWDTCLSIENWSNRLNKQVGKEVHDWWGANRRKWKLLLEQIVQEHPDLAIHSKSMFNWTHHTDMAVVEWIVTMREGLLLLEQFPKDVMRVNYEMLCNKPKKVLDEIINFLELSPGDNPFLIYSENTLRQTKPKQPFSVNPLIEKAFYDTMERLGYKI
jgi:hypothetical protein